MELELSQSKIEIKVATYDDIEELSRLTSVWIAMMDYDIGLAELEAEWKGHLDKGAIILARQHGKIVGFIYGYIVHQIFLHDNVAFENYFFVHPEKRGLGIGGLLANAFAAWAESKGCKAVIIAPNLAGSSDPHGVARGLLRSGFEYYGHMMRRVF